MTALSMGKDPASEATGPGHPEGGARQTSGPRTLTLKCPAKINLTLEVLGRYPDGYHRVSSIMQAVNVVDLLTISPAEEITFECDRPELSGPDNLVVKAARLLQQVSGHMGGAHLRLQKGIPEAAGLGGGSSDAAAALKGLNQVWGLSLERQRLVELASQLGSDVPFFMLGGTTLAEGRGEKVEELPAPGKLWLVIIHPPIFLAEKTRTLYQALTPDLYTAGEHTRSMTKVLRAGGQVNAEMLFNVFEHLAPSVFPGLSSYVERLLTAGASRTHLAGSGPTIFAVFNDREKAESVRRELHNDEAYIAHTIGPDY